jgi:UDP-2,3-diacylglucosamine hydrolase
VSAPAHWRVIDFISDLHLNASAPDTFKAWQHYMASTRADAVFILGDLFEVWVGDDAATPEPGREPGFEVCCQHVLAATSQRLSLYFMHGNRDFLLGNTFAQACGMTLLPDPTLLVFDEKRWLLSHGDALCSNDTDYQAFRSMVRSPAWRNAFLSKPLPERQAIARSLRAQSESRKAGVGGYADVDQDSALQWLAAAQAGTLIHGHTHQPADHLMIPLDTAVGEPLDSSLPGGTTSQSMPPESSLRGGTTWQSRKSGLLDCRATLAMTNSTGASRQRLVLSDWDANATPARLEVLRLRAGQWPERLKLDSGFEPR